MCLQVALSPVIVKLTPVLGILVGILVSLTLLFMGVLLLLRLRHKDYHRKKTHNTSVKVSCESVDSTEKNPDVIPQTTGNFKLRPVFIVHVTYNRKNECTGIACLYD